MASNEKTISQPIQIKCEGADSLPIEAITDFQGRSACVAQIKTNGTIQEYAR